MCSSDLNGMSLHGGFIPYGGTFLVFADYMRPAIRLAALMSRQVIYVLTHDSIGLGEDGPTHQPIEHLTSLRCIPNVLVLRPADAAETTEAWRAALLNRSGPTVLVLTRQKLALIDRTTHGAVAGVARGGYVLVDSDTAPRVVLLASGSEVQVALDARMALAAKGVPARVVSVPSIERFLAQDAAYRSSVLPAGVPRVAVEAGVTDFWWKYQVQAVVGIDTFGESAPAGVLFKHFGFTPENVADTVQAVLQR